MMTEQEWKLVFRDLKPDQTRHPFLSFYLNKASSRGSHIRLFYDFLCPDCVTCHQGLKKVLDQNIPYTDQKFSDLF